MKMINSSKKIVIRKNFEKLSRVDNGFYTCTGEYTP